MVRDMIERTSKANAGAGVLEESVTVLVEQAESVGDVVENVMVLMGRVRNAVREQERWEELLESVVVKVMATVAKVTWRLRRVPPLVLRPLQRLR